MWACMFYLIVCSSIIEIPAYQSRSLSNSIKSERNVQSSKKRLLARSLSSRVKKKKLREKKEDCWLTLNAKQHFKTMEALEKQFEKARSEYDEQQFYDKYDEEILGTLLADNGATDRETQKHANLKRLIPSGLNLGGQSMIRMTDSIMFFHRMKLRNDTVFRVNYLSSNFTNMVLTGRLALNDLHLIGSYERVQTTRDSPSTLFYTPSYGEVEFLLRNVIYKMEGRYRLQKDRLFVEVIISELYIPYDGILMTYRNVNSTSEATTLQTKHISDFLDRIKSDLDLWLKDFFNEFLLNNPPITVPSQEAFQKYDKERVLTLNRYVDEVLGHLTTRLEELGDQNVKLPNFSIYTFTGCILKLSDGTLSGLDTMYRRSMATNNIDNDVRQVDALVSFSNLKVRYTYEVQTMTGVPPLHGSLILTADELTALMSLHLVKNPLFVDLKFAFLMQLKPESLTVEGSVAGVIANFKHLLELHVIALMTNSMVDQVKALKSLVECVLIIDEKDNKLYINYFTVPTLLSRASNENGKSDTEHHTKQKELVANTDTTNRKKPAKRVPLSSSDESSIVGLGTTSEDEVHDLKVLSSDANSDDLVSNTGDSSRSVDEN